MGRHTFFAAASLCLVHATSLNTSLPPDWISTVHAESDSTYYINKKTMKATTERPVWMHERTSNNRSCQLCLSEGARKNCAWTDCGACQKCNAIVFHGFKIGDCVMAKKNGHPYLAKVTGSPTLLTSKKYKGYQYLCTIEYLNGV